MGTTQPGLGKEGDLSKPIIEALLLQKQNGKLSNSALENWVNTFENEYDIYYKHSSEEKQEDLSDAEIQFEALHKEVEDEYATKKFNSLVPQHKLLDSTIAKDKLKLSHKKSFRENLKKTSKDPNLQNDEMIKSFHHQPEKMNPPCKYPAVKNPFEIKNSPRNGKKILSSNVARENKQNPSEQLLLGKGPSNSSIQINKSNISKETELANSNNEEGIPTKHLTQEEKLNLTEIHSNKPVIENNEYEDIKVFKKRTKKKNKKVPILETIANEPNISCMDQMKQEEKDKNKKLVNEVKHKLNADGPSKPFETFQNCLFATFTTCVPWCIMKKIYWKKDMKSEELFTVTSRRNSRTRIRWRSKQYQGNRETQL